jgi:hypothetical protein
MLWWGPPLILAGVGWEILITTKSIKILGVAVSFLATLTVSQRAAVADDQLTLISPPGAPSNGAYLDNIYLSPYYFSINGSSAYTALICDDFSDEIYQGETWNANVLTGSQITTDQYVTGSASATDQKNYEEIGYLALGLFATLPSDTTDQAAYSYAIWSVFDPSGVQTYLNGYSSTYYATYVAPLLAQAATSATSKDLSILTVYQPVANSQTNCGGCSNPPQEFVSVNTPEASSPVILVLDLLGLFGAVFLARRRVLRNAAEATIGAWLKSLQHTGRA